MYKGAPITLSASRLFSRNSAGHKRVAQYIYSDERKKPATKNTLPGKVIIQILWKDRVLQTSKI